MVFVILRRQTSPLLPKPWPRKGSGAMSLKARCIGQTVLMPQEVDDGIESLFFPVCLVVLRHPFGRHCRGPLRKVVAGQGEKDGAIGGIIARAGRDQRVPTAAQRLVRFLSLRRSAGRCVGGTKKACPKATDAHANTPPSPLQKALSGQSDSQLTTLIARQSCRAIFCPL